MTKTISVLFCIASIIPHCVQAQFPSVVDLGNYDDDVRIPFIIPLELAIGDFDNDSYADILVGDYSVESDEGYSTGLVTIIFGATNLPSFIDGSNPTVRSTKIYGDDAWDQTGTSLSTGDVNGDGITDAIIGADQNFHAVGKGNVYIVYGRKDWPREISLDTDGGPVAGVTRIVGKAPKNFAGSKVATGDVNGDGAADVVIGAFGAGPDGEAGREGEVYVLYGNAELPAIVNLSDESVQRTTIHGIRVGNIGAFAGCLDINNDGYADVLVSDPDLHYSFGKVFIVYGKAAMPEDVSLAEQDDEGGIPGVTQIIGEQYRDRIGWNFAGGDVNGDGLNDLFIGAGQLIFDSGNDAAGKMHVLFGKRSYPPIISLNEYRDKLTIYGARNPDRTDTNPGDQLGVEVAAGDINDDGLTDILIGAPGAQVNGKRSGTVVLRYGSPSWPRELRLQRPTDRAKTVQIMGFPLAENVGWSVAAGDVNGDGIDDIVAGAPDANSYLGRGRGGETYIIYGRSKNYQPPEVGKPQVLQSFPNPFNASTVIRYRLDATQRVRLVIYNARGQEVRRLVDGPMEAGEHRAIWNGYGADFQPVSSGVYFCFLRGEDFTASQKLLYLK